MRQLLSGSLSLLRQLTEHKERLMNDVQENDMLKWQEDYTNAVQVKVNFRFPFQPIVILLFFHLSQKHEKENIVFTYSLTGLFQDGSDMFFS